MKACHLIPGVFLLFLASCVTQRAPVNNYLQHVSDTSDRDVMAIPDPVIQKNDLLSIRVFSMSIDPRTDIPYNLPDAGSEGSVTGGYLVDQQGNIEYPQIGTVHAAGLTKAQLAQVLKERLESSLKNPSVIVRFLNYRITVLGEVRSPSSYSVPTEKVTILEAIGLAGDITDFGNRTNVKVLRENNGQREIGVLDLTSGDIFRSPYYHLQQNDVVFVEQNRRKMAQQEQQQLAQQVGLVLSVITAVALILNIFK